MAPTHSKYDAFANTHSIKRGGYRLVPPPIGLSRPAEKHTDANYSFEKIKCRTNPGDANSTTYKIQLKYFKEDSPE